MKMCSVSKCEVKECAYNSRHGCHAIAITIGDSVHPRCDTFLTSQLHGGVKNHTAGVGACKVSGCIHNQELECAAPSIQVGYREGHGDCLTFFAR